MGYSEHQPVTNYQVIDGDVLPLDEPAGNYESETLIFDHIAGAIELKEQNPEQAEKMSRAERQMSLKERFHFYADTKDELTLATRLTASDDLVAGAATQLSRIQLHQEYKTRSKDPAAAARKITAEMAGYATTPVKDISFLRYLEQSIVESGLRGRVKVASVSGVSAWQYEPGVRRAVVDLLRHRETDDLVYRDGEDHIGDPFSVRDKEATARIEAFVASLTVAGAKDLIATRIAEHKAKSQFWTEQLEVVEKHYIGPVRAIASKALASLEVKKPHL